MKRDQMKKRILTAALLASMIGMTACSNNTEQPVSQQEETSDPGSAVNETEETSPDQNGSGDNTDTEEEERKAEEERQAKLAQLDTMVEEGREYFYGIHGKDEDAEKAEEIFQEVSGLDETNGDALFYLGRITEKKALDYDDDAPERHTLLDSSKTYYEKAVEAGRLEALYRIGDAYYKGYYSGGEAENNDKEKAAECFKEAYDKGCKAAGIGMAMIEEDDSKAIEYLEAASETEELYEKQLALRQLGEYYLPDNDKYSSMISAFIPIDPDGYSDHAKALEYFTAANETELGESGSIDMLIAQSYLMANGDAGYEDALNWYMRGGELGDSQCCRNAGYIYANGPDRLYDYLEAQKWYIKAVEISKPLYEANPSDENVFLYGAAEYELGMFYNNNEGFGYGNINNAAKAGYIYAMWWMGYCYQFGLQGSVNEKLALDWYEKALDKYGFLGWAEKYYNELK